MDREAKQKKLQQLVNKISKDARAAHRLARELYAEGFLFCESDYLYVMDGDGPGRERQEHIRLEGDGLCPIGGGAW